MSSSARLGREELKWIQSLDLSYSLKHIKRDFANGFLVAEILSRYYQEDVPMHSYDNGTSLQRKLDNWLLLQKFFQKRQIPISQELVNDIVHCKSAEAPVELVSMLYSLLTGRQPRQPASGPPPPAPLPSYARPNATEVVRQQVRDSELSTKLGDLSKQQQHVAALLDDHNVAERTEREAFAAAHPIEALRPRGLAAGAAANQPRGPPKPVGADIDETLVQFEEVQIKARETTTKGSFASPPYRSQPGGVTPQADEMVAAVAPPRGRSGATRGVLQILAEQVASVPVLSEGVGDNPAELIEMVIKPPPELPAKSVAAPLEAALAMNHIELANASLSSLHEAWQLFNLLFAVMSNAQDQLVFDAAANLLAATGREMSVAESLETEKFFVDFGLPKLVAIMRAHSASAAKMQTLASLAYAFTVDNDVAHIAVIKALQEALGDPRLFLLALAALIRFESGLSDDLLDLYVYYCIIALGMQSGRMRAAALSMLPVIAVHDHRLVLDMLPRLATLLADPWWEVQAQLAAVASALLALGDAGEAAPQLHAILMQALARPSPPLRAVALAACAPLLMNQPLILPAFLDSLLSVQPSRRSALLAGDGPSFGGAEMGTAFSIPSITEAWPPLVVVRGLVAGVKAASLTNLEAPHVDVLVAAMGGATREEAAEWADWLATAKEYVYVALCDEELCSPVCTALAGLFDVVGRDALPTFSTLLSSLRLIFPDGAPACQKASLGLLSTMWARGEPLAGAVGTIVRGFDEGVRSACFGALSDRIAAEAA